MPDLIKLSDLTTDSILSTLEARHKEGIVYTYVADIVLSVNPFAYGCAPSGKEACERYKGINAGGRKDSELPHVYALMDKAYASLKKTGGRAQSVLISGESGAGKTETTKVCLEFLRHVASESSGGGSADVAAFMKANPIIEAIGNAKTVRNDNSSRFGKHLDVQLDEVKGNILGAKTQAYLLEKPRVCQHLPGERNYHVLYMMLHLSNPHVCPSADDAPKPALPFTEWDEYKILSQEGTEGTVKGWVDYEEMQYMHKTLPEIGFDAESRRPALYKLYAFALVLGNVEFPEFDGDALQPTAKTAPLLAVAAEYAGVQYEKLLKALTHKMLRKNEVPRDPVLAVRSLVMYVYGLAFEWVIERINDTFGYAGPQKVKLCGILDVFGFENFDGEFGINSHPQVRERRARMLRRPHIK